ncbi:hypothetical protein ASPCADRAFT_127475 [Aspergillus carbonarius ITEM 5010]|uniref:Uncharacterized protein n=1 Tax=Aspergillus carbonarius (strain ITEM 5010) TaxID=602072 RepID=A0A1R3RWM3_ASPC5|nr:hypothetical protein ASPCADRAFT_127475 [Aspergillus carbonarius ITEM 5010]
MDPFQRLPVEIIQSIVQYIPDFVGLESLLLVSARVKAIFHHDPCVVDLDDLLASTYILGMPDIPRIFRQVALVHSQSIRSSSGDDNNDSASENCPVSSATLLYMIHIAAQIQRQACICLPTMRHKFCTAVETHLAASIETEDFAGPFSWVEEYRTYWALWHLRHYSDLQKLARDHINSPDNISIVKRLKTYASWNGLGAPVVDVLLHRVEEIWSIAATLTDLGLHASYGSLARQQEEPRQDRQGRPSRIPMPLFTSFKFPPRAIDHPVWCPPPVPDNTAVDRAWDRAVRTSEDASRGSFFYQQLVNIVKAFRPADPAIQDMPLYRRLGVFIWDSWRLYSAGLEFITTGNTPAPNGGFVQSKHIDQETIYDMHARWLALRGKN